MKKIGFILMTFVLLTGVMSSCDGELEYDSSGKISGTVIDMENGDPIHNALITISPSSSNNTNVYSGYDGHFEFSGLESKQYTLTVQKSGYITNRKQVEIKAGNNVEVGLAMQRIQ